MGHGVQAYKASTREAEARISGQGQHLNYTGSPQAVLDLGELVRNGTQVLRLDRKQLLSYFWFFKTECLCVAALALLELAL